jgi:CubicO group peptidase (beta-lactamase class C family)
MKTFVASLALIAFTGIVRPVFAAATQVEDPAVRAILHQGVYALGKNIVLVAGIIDGKQTRIFSEGSLDSAGRKPADGDTLFEIGSVTKVFTSLLLADMVQRHELQLNDPISKFLPASVKPPTRNGQGITLLDLAAHTSGLPRLPDNFAPKDPSNPYADYTVNQMYAFLSTYKLPRDIGTQYEYSNYGAGLLAHLLSLNSHTSYETLVESRICKPLGMADTHITLTPVLKSRLAPGHDESGAPAANWDFLTLGGCGALHSTANDLLKFVSANMGITHSSLDDAMQLQQIPHRDTTIPATRIALAWHITKMPAGEVCWHNGGTAGYHAFIGFDRDRQRGVVLLSNCAADIDGTAIALLERAAPARQHVAISVDPVTYDAFAGKYQLAPGIEFTVRRDNSRLLVQLTGQPFIEVFPESPTDFFYKAVDAQLTFVKNPAGEVTHLFLHQNAVDQKAVKEK